MNAFAKSDWPPAVNSPGPLLNCGEVSSAFGSVAGIIPKVLNSLPY
jgi:hypothetical protein